MAAMKSPQTYPEPVTRSHLAFHEPGSWWSADQVWIRGREDPEIVYAVSMGEGNPIGRRDVRGRRVLEAFTAVPMDEVVGRVMDYWTTRRRRQRLDRAQQQLLTRARPLLDFVANFGPVGVGWGAEFPLRLQTDGGIQRGEWTADFTSLGRLRFGIGVARPAGTARVDEPLWERLEHDEALRGDRLELLAAERRDLLNVVHLLRALDRQATDDGVRVCVMQALRVTGSVELPMLTNRSSSWARAVRDPDTIDGPLRPFDRDASRVHWPVFGRLAAAELISRQLNWVHEVAVVGSAGEFVRELRPTSLMEFMYLQLLAHLERRSYYGFGDCNLCGGVLLMTRKKATVNRHHEGCGAVARQRRFRDRAVEGATG